MKAFMNLFGEVLLPQWFCAKRLKAFMCREFEPLGAC